MSRAAPHLREPGQDLTHFPRTRLAGGTTVFRCHSADNGPWWFASRPDDEPGGRFDLQAPHGTCYVALDDQTAVLERFGPQIHRQGVVFEEAARGARISALKLPEDVDAADTADRRAAAWVTRELMAGGDYRLTQRWAAAFFRAGCTGIRYQSRFATGHDQFAVALFGEQGTRPWPQGVPAEVVEVLEQAGIKVLRPLRLRSLHRAERPSRT